MVVEYVTDSDRGMWLESESGDPIPIGVLQIFDKEIVRFKPIVRDDGCLTSQDLIYVLSEIQRVSMIKQIEIFKENLKRRMEKEK